MSRAGGVFAPGPPAVVEQSTRLHTLFGEAMASSWATIPPSEAPTTWAKSRPSRSSTDTASAAIVPVVVGSGRVLDAPEPRWSTATTVKASASSSITSSNAATGTTYPDIQSRGGPEPRTV